MNRDQGPSVIMVPSEATLGSPTDEPPLRLVLPAALLFGLAVVEGWRHGGFWPSDALAVAILSLLVLAAATTAAPRDPAGVLVTGSLLWSSSWWLFRAVTAGSADAFLPFGASILAFAAAFTAVRPLHERSRQVAALAVACLGATER
jgi:hypothetical protein